jgi:hypothetical protein
MSGGTWPGARVVLVEDVVDVVVVAFGAGRVVVDRAPGRPGRVVVVVEPAAAGRVVVVVSPGRVVVVDDVVVEAVVVGADWASAGPLNVQTASAARTAPARGREVGDNEDAFRREVLGTGAG